jgi:hypothetical protein
MLNGVVDSRKKVTMSSQSPWGSSFIPRRSKDRLEIERLKESLRQRDEEMRHRDEAMRQQDDFYASAFAQQQMILQIS